MKRAECGEIAIITGASSGIGREIALILDGIGYETVLVARRAERLEELRLRMKNPSRTFVCDLSESSECYRLFEQTAGDNIQVLVNCAGFGAVGYFDKTDLSRELEMIDVNVRALHILTKLYLKKFTENDSGYILNVASCAGIMPGGPMMATYYASKAYVYSLTNAISYELKEQGSNVYVGALCPGPVDTEFNDVAKVHFAAKGIDSKKCALYAVMEMFNRKTTIIPTATVKLMCAAQSQVPKGLVLKVASKYQKMKLD